MWKSFERMYTTATTDQQRMQIYADIRYWLSPDRALVTDEIKELSSKLDNLCEQEMIKLMKKWCPIDLTPSIERSV